MNKIITSFLMSSLLTLAACSSHSGKSVFDPNDVGHDQDSSNSGTVSPTPPPAQPPAVEPPAGPTQVPTENVEPFPEDTQKYYQAWKRTDTSILLDCYQGNSINWDKVATDPRVTGVLHRATIGLRADTGYEARKAIAGRHGYFWGAYHLGTSGDPIAQAQFYLKTIGDPTNILMVLDLEDTDASSMMNIPNAKIFVQYIYQQTGRIPVIYANQNVTKLLTAAVKTDPYFKASRLWYARFQSNISDFPRGLWSGYFMWQFSSMLNCSRTGSCLYNVPGTDHYIDVNVFYGTREALREQWTL
jgi:GH25 family lysozyme M1 (1,4-beta-N-acetylmuramidase)